MTSEKVSVKSVPKSKLRSALKEELALGFDWETSGLTKHPDADLRKQPKAIEFGGALISLSTGKIVDEFNVLIDPQESLDADVIRITGLTDDQLRGQLTFLAAWPKIRPFFDRAVACFAHNLPFDKMILSSELRRHGVGDFVFPKRQTCTVGLYREQWGRNPKLLELYEAVLGRPLAQTHRALDDVKAMVEIVQKEELWQVM